MATKKTSNPTKEEEVTIANPKHTSIIYGNHVIKFTDGKATISPDTASKFREQGLIK